ncbi:MAG: 3'(2'),5'-bisphosphate nucleotidase CysQ [Bacilli bacterium]|nr:3'(2'),5'-bisphosphate nucleotidase CysQ [Bacilli bacterium]
MLELELRCAIEAAKEAEKAILTVYSKPFAVEIKDDDSPVTEADKMADEIIRGYLSARFPDDAFLTEESADTPERFSKKRVWIVDPVDGTKEFVSRNGEFATNIALCENGQIVLGVINAPALGVLYFAVKGEGAYRLNPDGTEQRLHVDARTEQLRVMRSISFFRPAEESYLAKNKIHFLGEPTPVGAALKFAALAEGRADFFIRLSPSTKEWDVAAGDLLVKEAGGFMCQPSGADFTYNRKDVYNRNGYVMGNKLQPWMLDF